MGSYSDKKSENFSAYCRDGKINFVKKWIDNPEVDINWNYHSPLRNAVKFNRKDVIELLLNNPKIKTDYQNQSRELTGDWNKIRMVFNPFTETFKEPNIEILDYFMKSGKFEAKRTKYLDILIQINNQELNNYFTRDMDYVDYILSQDSKYLTILPEDLQQIFFVVGE